LHPAETDPPAFVDPNAILPQTIAGQSLQTVSGNRAQIREFASGMNLCLGRAGSRYKNIAVWRLTQDGRWLVQMPVY
jgi:hypothetical protein